MRQDPKLKKLAYLFPSVQVGHLSDADLDPALSALPLKNRKNRSSSSHRMTDQVANLVCTAFEKSKNRKSKFGRSTDRQVCSNQGRIVLR
jgi:hypothetical protein